MPAEHWKKAACIVIGRIVVRLNQAGIGFGTQGIAVCDYGPPKKMMG